MQLNGQQGITGWRWIFIIEGVITCALAIAGYWLLVDFPDSQRKSWRFLGQREREWVVNRIQQDRGDSKVPPFNLRKFLGAGADWKIWAYAMIFFNTTTMSYALAYTLPILLVGNMKFTVAQAQCLVAPPYVLAGIGGIVGSLVFRDQDKATGYKPGMYTCIACSLLSVILILLCDWDFYRQNKLADQGKKSLESHDDVSRRSPPLPRRLFVTNRH